MSNKVKKQRIKTLQHKSSAQGPVVYWMSRDQRLQDNWALLYAQEKALESKNALLVVFCLVPTFLGATQRQYGFMLNGLRELQPKFRAKNIPFILLIGPPEKEIPLFIKKYKVKELITDFDPLRIKKSWKDKVKRQIDISFYEVDAHNIIPCWEASDKEEYGAYTLRPKIHRLLNFYLEDFPKVRKHPYPLKRLMRGKDIQQASAALKINKEVKEVSWLIPGEKEARRMLKRFLTEKINDYAQNRNDPNLEAQSDLSPYLHFGQISAQRVVLEVVKSSGSAESQAAFLEELIIRRELSDNYCYYNRNYDRFSGVKSWAQTTLNQHRKDRRDYVYSREQFELGQTHDELWNAAQHQMVQTGKMHGYMRMYWAKKILEWSLTPEQAFQTAIYLNDKYQLDGRDPNGYAGVAWSIGGVHDRAWGERPVFGKIRFMSYNGCKSKFDANNYIQTLLMGEAIPSKTLKT